jgi:hypothetical protein
VWGSDGGAAASHGRWINAGVDGEVRVRILDCWGETISVRLEGVGSGRGGVRRSTGETGGWMMPEEVTGDSDSDSKLKSTNEPCGERRQGVTVSCIS